MCRVSSNETRHPAPAKINLGLHVLRRRKDGFHAIETGLLSIGWQDVLTARPAEHFAFTCSDPDLPTDARNLVVRAVLAFEAATQQRARVALHLDKHVPHGAGLGGGSSDAARALLLLRDRFAPGIASSKLHEIAAGLGSDVPFFLHKAPMLATGRGEILEPLAGYAFPFHLTVVMPSVHVGTAEAYALVRPHDTDRPDLSAVIRSNDLDRWRQELVNDFEPPILARHQEIGAAKRALLEFGAEYAALSGSGAAVFGIFERASDAAAAADAAESTGLRAWTSAY